MDGEIFREWVGLISDPLEIFAAITGFACVWLSARQNIWNWPVSIVSVFLYAIIFYHSKLYSDSALQIIFVFFQIYGWIYWVIKKNGKSEIKVTILNKNSILGIAVVTIVCWLIWWKLLIFLKPDAEFPIWDSLTTCMSLTAIFLQARKKIENWYLWFIIDSIYIPLYIYKLLFLTAFLSLVFLFLAVYGWWKWRKNLSH